MVFSHVLIPFEMTFAVFLLPTSVDSHSPAIEPMPFTDEGDGQVLSDTLTSFPDKNPLDRATSPLVAALKRSTSELLAPKHG